MAHADDLPSPPEGFLWTEYTVRLLYPEGATYERDQTMSERFQRLVEIAEEVDVLASMPVGRGGRCATCGQVTIVTEGFPWGRDRYGNGDVYRPYCPHCHGAEDVE